eukprot:CAMPEP_0176068104 /NCGR_PEP_ID=MMETSP0120_2-20121206/33995_1 /TAXON_ID=160619 /ORGANISM="Kryptoperidinium foliaceum, Strain CCMP 1326" /LENGTH=981 /DNA_ID=CAMNT_0017401723 /DNA_START=13 /DNA_END=2958 /DNA_ORIENTATION=-
MGKKTKTGKGRLDKYYQLAKDQGYRARSAFKLIQLAKKHDFLSKATVCLDLCAAPGGWSQVAQRNMPSGSLIIAIDLCPIKPIHGVTCIQSDITTDKCRSLLKKELLGKRADVVLHDGAPNVGSSWSKDAYGQNELTLHSLKLACEHLRAGGAFVTKVFRSSDYNSLMWVFGQLFSKVDATKPTASRNVSAEIFVMCLGFKAGKIDPRFFDPKWVFMETLDPLATPETNQGVEKKKTSLTEYLKHQSKRHRGGYDPGDLRRDVSVKDFFDATNPAEVLVTHHRIIFDAEGCESVDKHPTTTDDIRELCADLKVLGKKDLTTLMKWRAKIVREREKAERAARKAEQEAAEKASGSKAKSSGNAANDIDEAISGLLDDDAAKAAKKQGDDSAAEEEADEQLEQELAEQVEKRRREEKREAKKTMERQKKQEMRKKMSLVSSRNSLADQPDLFKISDKAIHALENQETYLDSTKLDSDAEQSSHDEGPQVETDSDDGGLDRVAKMEVDIAVDMQLRKLRNSDKFRNQAQRVDRAKKQSRRQRVFAAWAGEMNEFNAAIQQKAGEERALRDKEAEESDAADDEDSEDDLKTLRDLQNEGGKSSAIDGGALEALLDGPNKRDEETDESDDEGEDAPTVAEGSAKESTSTAIVPQEEHNELELRAEHRTARWFSQDIFRSVRTRSNKIIPLDRDSEDESSDGEGGKIREVPDNKLPKLPLTDKQKRSLKRKKDDEKDNKKGKKLKKDEVPDEEKGPLEIAPMELPKPLVPASGKPVKPSDPQELAETLALGSILVDSKKSRMDIIDAAYNRWAFEEDPMLPDWFTEEENRFNKPMLPVSKELMAQYRAKLREINARPIRKVAQAKARKQRRLTKRLDKLRSTAMSLVDAPDMSELAKAKQMRKAVRKLSKQEDRKVTVVAIKKGGGGTRMNKGKVPKGAKVKVVDRRLKSDLRGLKKAAERNKRKAKVVAKKQQLKKQGKAQRRGIR